MLYEWRIYTATPGRMNALNEDYHNLSIIT